MTNKGEIIQFPGGNMDNGKRTLSQEEYMALIFANLEQENIQVTSMLIEQILQNYPGALNDLRDVAEQLRGGGKKEAKAKSLLKIIVARVPDDYQSRYLLGLCLENEGNLEAAKNHFLKVLEIAPGETQSLAELAKIYENEENYFEALKYYLRLSKEVAGEFQQTVNDRIRELQQKQLAVKK